MSAIRFIAVSLAAASVALPVLAAEDIGLANECEEHGQRLGRP